MSKQYSKFRTKTLFFIALKMSNFVPNSHHLREILFHYFIWKTTAAEFIEFLWKFMVNMLYQKQRAEIGFNLSKVVISTSGTKTVKNHRKNLKQLAKAMEVDQGTISRRLHAIAKIQKKGKWVPYELKTRDI